MQCGTHEKPSGIETSLRSENSEVSASARRAICAALGRVGAICWDGEAIQEENMFTQSTLEIKLLDSRCSQSHPAKSPQCRLSEALRTVQRSLPAVKSASWRYHEASR